MINKPIYLIYEAWTDSMENHPSNAFGYEVVGYTLTEEEAAQFVEAGGEVPKTFSWVLDKPASKYYYRKLDNSKFGI